MFIPDCPKCGKKSIVREGSLYVCLDSVCNFRRDIHDQPTQSQSLTVDLIWGVISGIILFIALLSLFSPTAEVRPMPRVGELREESFTEKAAWS